MPLVSIITITYNAGKVLDPTMRSVAEQTFRDYEHIIIDGASSDNTLEIARKYEGTRILSEPDRGLYDAMNKGLRMATGDYLIFLNAGDAFRNSEVLARYAERAAAGDDIIFADTMIVDAQRKDVGPRHLTAPQRLTKKSFAEGMLICHQAFMVRRAIAPEFDLQWRFSADYDWTVRCIGAADMSKCTNLGIVAINYLNDGLTDNNKLTSLKERYRIMSRHYGSLPTLFRHIGFFFRALRRRL